MSDSNEPAKVECECLHHDTELRPSLEEAAAQNHEAALAARAARLKSLEAELAALIKRRDEETDSNKRNHLGSEIVGKKMNVNGEAFEIKVCLEQPQLYAMGVIAVCKRESCKKQVTEFDLILMNPDGTLTVKECKSSGKFKMEQHTKQQKEIAKHFPPGTKHHLASRGGKAKKVAAQRPNEWNVDPTPTIQAH